VADIESDNLLDEATLLHVLSYQILGKEVKSIDKTEQARRIVKFFQHHIHKKIPIVFHNGISFDIPLVEKILGIDLSELMVIDTLGLSWHLNPKRKLHGLASFFEDYGIAKPKVTDWEGLTHEEYENRCVEDVRINTALWEDLMERLVDMYTRSKDAIDAGLVGGTRTSPEEVIYLDSLVGLSVDEHIDRILTFLMFKMDCNRLQEKTRWKVDVEFLEESLTELTGLLDIAQVELEAVMPKIAEYAARKSPAKPYLMNGELSASGRSWEEIREMIRTKAKDDYGHLIILEQPSGDVKKLKGYAPPNINSSGQIKEFLYSNGWVPENFKFVRDKEAFDQWIQDKPSNGSPRMLWSSWKDARPVDRKVPQVSVEGKEGKELCPSVVRLSEEVPEILAYSKYTTIKHRRDLLKGFQENMSGDGYLQARIGGLTNTLRVKHREVVNLPGVSKPYGQYARRCLVAGKGNISLGSDLSSLEDRVKHHFMLPHDAPYVETMLAEDYDPHLTMAVSAGFITQEQMDEYKSGVKLEDTEEARRLGKSTNYASVYNSGAATLARAAKISVQVAEKLLKAYWILNWSVKAIAEEQYVIKDASANLWLVNPINGFCYSLRKESDKFSTLAQGTGSYFFDMWVNNLLDLMQERFHTKRLTASFHDEYISIFKDTESNRETMTSITMKALEMVNEKYLIRRPLGCGVEFGQSYAEIH
jgi:hypothetical protein